MISCDSSALIPFYLPLPPVPQPSLSALASFALCFSSLLYLIFFLLSVLPFSLCSTSFSLCSYSLLSLFLVTALSDLLPSLSVILPSFSAPLPSLSAPLPSLSALSSFALCSSSLLSLIFFLLSLLFFLLSQLPFLLSLLFLPSFSAPLPIVSASLPSLSLLLLPSCSATRNISLILPRSLFSFTFSHCSPSFSLCSYFLPSLQLVISFCFPAISASPLFSLLFFFSLCPSFSPPPASLLLIFHS